jgi:hypothetical protein
MGSIKVVKIKNITKEAAEKLAKAAKGNLFFKLNPTTTTTKLKKR